MIDQVIHIGILVGSVEKFPVLAYIDSKAGLIM